MTTKQNPAKAAPHQGASEGHAPGGTADQMRRFRDFIGFFGSLVGLVLVGLSVLPASTAMEKFLVIVAAFALSCAITLAVKLIPWSRPATWLAISSAVGIASLAALSLVTQQDARSTLAATEALNTPGATGTTVPETHSPDPSTNTPSSGQTPTNPSPSSASTSQQSPYTLDYNTDIEMPGDNCEKAYGESGSYVTFTQQSAKVTVVTDSSGGGGDIEISCVNSVAVQFNDQAARMTGDPSPSQCASEITTHPISGSVPFQQLQPGSKFCFVAGGESAPGPLVLATVKTVTGSPTFTTTWSLTAWSLPPTS